MIPNSNDVLRVEVRFKNARLYDAIVAHDLPVLRRKSAAGQAASMRGKIKWFCDFYLLNTNHVYGFVNLKENPFTKKLEMKDCPQRLCALLEREPEWLFPVKLYEQLWRPFVGYLSGEQTDQMVANFYRQLAYARQTSLPTPSADTTAQIMQTELAERLQNSLVTLTPREQKSLERGFGIGDDIEHTREEIGQILGVGHARVRQIQSTALRKMRHPSRSRPLKSFLDDEKF